MSNCGDILIIEDDFAIGDFLSEALSDEGYTVRVIPDAARLSDALTTHIPDLVLSDLHMPGLSDRPLIIYLQGMLPADVPIVIMTADAHAAGQFADMNVAFCLVKPFDLDALFTCVATYIRVLH